MGKLRILAVAFVAVLALGATMASAAFASYDVEAETASEAIEGTLEGDQKEFNVFFTDAGTVECEVAHFEGHGIGTPTEVEPEVWTFSEVTVTPLYEDCTAFGQEGTVNVNGCDYRFATASISSTPFASVSVVCPEEPITVTAGKCTVTVGSQSGLSRVMLDNEGSGSGREVLATAEVGGIEYTTNGCAGNKTYTDGEYEGSVLLHGENTEGVRKGVWVT